MLHKQRGEDRLNGFSAEELRFIRAVNNRLESAWEFFCVFKSRLPGIFQSVLADVGYRDVHLSYQFFKAALEKCKAF